MYWEIELIVSCSASKIIILPSMTLKREIKKSQLALTSIFHEICSSSLTLKAVGAASKCYWDKLMLLKCELMLLKCELML